MLKYLGYRTLVGLAQALPLNCQYGISRVVADAHYLLDHRARKSVQANMRVILGESAPDSIVRKEARWVFRSFGLYLSEFLGFRRFGPKFLDENVAVQGREHVDAALARGRGIIFCSAHYSNWELGTSIFARLGYPMVAIAQMHDNQKVNEIFIRQRAEFGVTVVHSHNGAKEALKALRQNKCVALLGDRTTGGPVVPVKLFGKTTYLPQGPWRISNVSGAPLLPSFIHRRFNGSYTAKICAPVPESLVVHPRVSDDCDKQTRQAHIQAIAQGWADEFEALLRADPCQWANFFRVWDDPASGAPGAAQSLACKTDQQVHGEAK